MDKITYNTIIVTALFLCMLLFRINSTRLSSIIQNMKHGY